LAVRFAIEVSFREYEVPERLLPAGGGWSKKSEESKESSAYAPLGVLVGALNLRRVPTYSPTNGLAPWRRVDRKAPVRWLQKTPNRLTTR
jgi:hypothetical protein